ncbi:MAG: glycosyltransferase family 2 protein [Bacteroidales bacterium]|nr:glycosyltransferase family 2 protein [Bacteroidales bacterium]
MKISVVIAVKDGERWIDKAIRSVLRQKGVDIELIVVEDGSTDSTLRRLRRYGRRLRVHVHPFTKGLYFSRNEGLKLANGDYITFVDADDWLSKDSLRHAYETAEATQADVTQMTVKRRTPRFAFPLPHPQNYHPDSLLDSLSGDDSLFPVQCWGKLYKTSFLREHQGEVLDFDGFWGEDRLFLLPLAAANPRIAVCPAAKYNYRWGGLTTYKRIKPQEVSHVHRTTEEFLQSRGLLSPERKRALQEQEMRFLDYISRPLGLRSRLALRL